MKRYAHEKIAFMQKHRPDDEHVLVIPGAKTEVTHAERSRIYSIRSPLVSRSAQYRALLDLRAIDEVIERERPDILESGDPYQVGWQALRSGHSHRTPVVAFYHSHFAEAYLRPTAERFGSALADVMMKGARSYVRNFYNRFDATLVPSAGLCHVLRSWGVKNFRPVELGVNTDIFVPGDDRAATRHSLGIGEARVLLLYVGRLAAEKNTATLFAAFELLARRSDAFHLLVIGDGQERESLQQLEQRTARVTWIPYCTDTSQLGQCYRAADLFVHPGVEETFGLVALESQACGTPVVGIRGTFMDEVIVHDQTAWANQNSADDLATAITTITATDLRALGSSAAQRVAERYAWPAVFDRLFSIYRDVIEGYRNVTG